MHCKPMARKYITLLSHINNINVCYATKIMECVRLFLNPNFNSKIATFNVYASQYHYGFLITVYSTLPSTCSDLHKTA